jgi:hypothetical protein
VKGPCAIIFPVALVFMLAACSSPPSTGSPIGAGSSGSEGSTSPGAGQCGSPAPEVQINGGYKPPFLPIRIAFSGGELYIVVEGKISTPIGQFDFGPSVPVANVGDLLKMIVNGPSRKRTYAFQRHTTCGVNFRIDGNQSTAQWGQPITFQDTGKDRMGVLWESNGFQPAAAHCASGQEPGFVLGVAALHDQIGDVMGVPLECEHEGENGDRIQATSTQKGNGLAYWRKSTNTPTFTDGWNHWALTSRGVTKWAGPSIDPPR